MSSPLSSTRHLPVRESLEKALSPYLQLPVFRDSHTPLVDPEHFRPAEGTGENPIPELIQDLLRPRSTEAPSTEPPPHSSVRVDCKHDRMFIEVDRAVLGSSDPQGALRVGRCSPNTITEDYVNFELRLWLNECDTEWSLKAGRLVFNNTLHFEPTETRSLIRRSAPFSVDVSCFFNRYQYSYLMAYLPKRGVRNLFKRMRSRDKFTLTAKNAQWQPLSPSDAFTLGTPMFFEAQTEVLPAGKRLYLHSCFATPEPAPSSEPRFDIISNHGCMLESKDGRSTFIPSANNAVRFSVDAFVFKEFEGNTLHMHCTMSVGPHSPTVTDKSCNFSPETHRWVELSGSEGVCFCCDFTCGSSASPEAVISSKALAIDAEPKASIKKHKSRISGTKRRSKLGHGVSRPRSPDPEERPERGQSKPVYEALRWTVAGPEQPEVQGSAEVELIQEPEPVLEDIVELV